MKIRSYSELVKLPTFLERYNYLKVRQRVGDTTFACERSLNQFFYRSPRWKRVRDMIIIRDNACDLGVEGRDIRTVVHVHHLNPITIEDVINDSPYIYDPEFLICTTFETHQAIHYGDEHLLIPDLVERKPWDTCPWK